MTGDADDRETLSRLTQNGQEALADLFCQHRDRLWRMIRLRLDHRLAARMDPSDVLQEVYLDAVQRLGGYLDNPAIPFPLWLRLLTGRRLLEVHRRHLGAKRRSAEQELSLEQGAWPVASPAAFADHLVGSLTSPSQAAMRHEVQGRLADALSRMDPIDREVLVLRHFDELSNNEVAGLLGLQKSAASNRYVRALDRLREILAEMPELRPL